MEATIEFKGVEFVIDYDYSPEEPMVMYYKDGSGYPGCAEEWQINDIYHNGVDFTELLEPFEEEIINCLREESC